MLNFYDFIQVYVFTTNHHLKCTVLAPSQSVYQSFVLVKGHCDFLKKTAGICQELSSA